MIYNGMLRLKKKNLRTYPNSAVVLLVKLTTAEFGYVLRFFFLSLGISLYNIF
jgi:hypothetical protein